MTLHSSDPNVSEATASAYICTICGEPTAEAINIEDCPHCRSPSRTRSLPVLLEKHIAPRLKPISTEKPVLAFAMTKAERNALSRLFPFFKSVSLYGNCGGDHTIGVDARDLTSFADAAFATVFSVLLFDYFAEHKKAIHEAARVLAPGGVFMTLILDGRVRMDDSAPQIIKSITPKPGYFDYLPAGSELLSVAVGRDWFVTTMRHAGFDAQYIPIVDPISARTSHWFVGWKPEATTLVQPSASQNPDFLKLIGEAINVLGKSPKGEAQPSPAAAKFALPTAQNAIRLTALADYVAPSLPAHEPLPSIGSGPQEKRYVVPLARYQRPSHIDVRLSVPQLPGNRHGFYFGDHAVGCGPKGARGEVVLNGTGCVCVSYDNGDTWSVINLAETDKRLIENVFICDDGSHILQLRAYDATSMRDASPSARSKDDKPERPTILVYSSDWQFVARSEPTTAHWHGSQSIGQSGTTIMFAEYHDNAAKYRDPWRAKQDLWLPHMRANCIHRSRDGGRTWEIVLSQSPLEIRHLHVCTPDPTVPGGWWATSGDRSSESCIWYSPDNGDTWQNVTHPDPDVTFPTPESNDRRSVFRLTSLGFTEDRIFWGTDDLLGVIRDYWPNPEKPLRAGARAYWSYKTDPLFPVEIGYCGMPIRAMVDLGPAWLMISEAKYRDITITPQIHAIFKDDETRLHHLFDIENFAPNGSGFTFSKASRKAVNGRFFCKRAGTDAFPEGARVLQWDVDFKA